VLYDIGDENIVTG